MSTKKGTAIVSGGVVSVVLFGAFAVLFADDSVSGFAFLAMPLVFVFSLGISAITSVLLERFWRYNSILVILSPTIIALIYTAINELGNL